MFTPQCVGVDGAKSGWIAAWRDGNGLDFKLFESAQALLASNAEALAIAVDIPLGLSDKGPRAADVEARRFVGGRRACSVFPAPVRGILNALSQPEASRLHREIDGRGFGAHAFGILSKVREWNAALLTDQVASQVYEIHPEVSFAAMNGGLGLLHSKKSIEGAEARKLLLARTFTEPCIDRLLRQIGRLAATDDVLDALAALWSAERIVSGYSKALPDPPEIDSQRFPVAIHY